MGGKRQEQIMNSFMPWGIGCNRFMVGVSQQETDNNTRAVHRAKGDSLITVESISTKGYLKRYQRLYLTPSGIKFLIEQNGLSSYLDFSAIATATVKRNLNSEKLQRFIRFSDAQIFLSSVGVVSTCEAVFNYNENPFIFGLPNAKDLDEDGKTNFYGLLMDAMLKKIEADKCESIICEADIPCVFIPSNQIPFTSANTGVVENNISKNFNNSVGLLLDIANRNAYIVFKWLDRKSLRWITRAYQSSLGKMQGVMQDAGIKNLQRNSGYIDTAIILCETEGEIHEKIKLCADNDLIKEPFLRIVPILMKKQGADELNSILSYGIHEFWNMSTDSALSAVSEATRRVASNGEVNYYKNGVLIRNGTEFDLWTTNRVKKDQYIGVNSYLACHPNQAEIYTKYAGIDKSRLIIVDDTQQ